MDGLSNAAREKERAASLSYCRDTINRISDKGLLQRAHIETLISERVRNSDIQNAARARDLHQTGFFLGKALIGHLIPQNGPDDKLCCFFSLGLLQSLLQIVRPQRLRIAGPRGVDCTAQGEHEVSDASQQQMAKWI